MRFNIRLFFLFLIVAMLSGAGGVAIAQTPDVVSNPGALPPGIYVFYDWQRIDPTKYPVAGGQMIFTWDNIEYQKWKYNWSNIDKFVADMAAKGKKAGLRINSYDGECCGGSHVPSFHKTATPSVVITCSGVEIPRYWDSSYKFAWEQLIKAFGARYNNDARVAWVEISSGIFGETAPSEDKHDPCLQSAGLTSDKWVATVNWSTDIYRAAFPNKQLLLQYAPRYLDRSERRKFSDYAAAKGVGLKHNGLKPDGGGDMYITDPANSAYLAGQYDPLSTWDGQVATAFEGTESSVGLSNAASTMWSIYNGLDKHVDWLVLDDKVVTKPEYQDSIAFGAKYVGKSITETPSIWSALRETEYDWFPDYGNFEFWLYQRDKAPGGKTVPLWNITTAPQGRYTRRTDQGTGNPNMFFDVDDSYALGSSFNVTVKVTYLDSKTDRWELRYMSGGVERVGGSVVKKNTGAWQKATFELFNVDLDNAMPGATDLRIYSVGDGDETIHMVDVVATPGKPNEVTLQPGVSGYNGLRDTYITSWSPDKNFNSTTQVIAGHPDSHFGLLRFDLASLPKSARVVTATLSVYQSGGAPSYAVNLDLYAHRLLRTWDAAAATWNRASASVAWQQPGAMGAADRQAIASGTTHTYQTIGWAHIDITALAQTWLNDPVTNYGLLLRAVADRNSQFYLNSSEAAEPTLRPRLYIAYYDPPKNTPTPTPTSAVTRTPTATVSRTATATPTSVRTNTPTGAPTATATASATASPTPSLIRRALISRKALSAPRIDGDLSEWTQPENVQVNAATADRVDYQALPSMTDISSTVQSYWDGAYVYYAVRVRDDAIWRDSTDVWDDDSVELALDGANDQIPLAADDHQFTITSDGVIADFGVALSPEASAAFSVAARRQTGGYDIEVAIPVSYLAAGPLTEGKRLGFTIGLNDDDDGGKRISANDSWLVWEGDNTYNRPAGYGELVLGAPYDSGMATSTPTANATNTPTPTSTSTLTVTPSATPTATVTPSATPTVTVTPAMTATATRTLTVTASATPTLHVTSTPSPTQIPTGRISGRVWLDRNRNGILDVGEPGVVGITLFLASLGASGEYPVPGDNVMAAITQANGTYSFTSVKSGYYSLVIEEHPNLRATTARKVSVLVNDNADIHEISFGVSESTLSVYLPLLFSH